jgi:uncharacterized membrane protein SpoIIM required for sporulation
VNHTPTSSGAREVLGDATLGRVDLDAYVAEHAGEWRRMEHLSGRRKLSAQEADELIALYQRAATHLSVIRSRSPDPALVARLSRMVFAARSAITGGPRFSWHGVGRFFTVVLPLEIYRTRRWWVSVALTFTALSMGLALYVAGHPEVALAFRSEAEIDQIVNSDFAGYYSEFQAQNFALRVWTNNAWVCALCLASGILVAPVIYLLFENGLNLGIVGGIMIGHDRSDVFFGMILPHGLLELTAVFIAAGAGLRIGWAWIAPGPRRTRGRALAETARGAMVIALGLVGVLAVSGLLEAFVTPSGLPPLLTVGFGVVCWLAFLTYVFVLGSKAAAEGHSTDLDATLNEAAVPTV